MEQTRNLWEFMLMINLISKERFFFGGGGLLTKKKERKCLNTV